MCHGRNGKRNWNKNRAKKQYSHQASGNRIKAHNLKPMHLVKEPKTNQKERKLQDNFHT